MGNGKGDDDSGNGGDQPYVPPTQEEQKEYLRQEREQLGDEAFEEKYGPPEGTH